MEKNDYSKYADIKIESLSFLWGNSRNKSTYNRLKQNNIETLKDLFEKYDSDSIVLPIQGKDAKAQIRAIIELIRYKYLNTELLIDPYLREKIEPYQVLPNSPKPFYKVMSCLRALGFENRQASSLTNLISKTLNRPQYLGDILIDLYESKINLSGIGANEYEDYKIKLSLLVTYNNKRRFLILIESEKSQIDSKDSIITAMYIKSLEEEEKQLLIHRDNLDKKIKIVQTRIQELKEQEPSKSL